MSGMGRVLILGAKGQVGQELQRSFAPDTELISCDRNEADLARPEQLREVVRRHAPSVILNAAAYTAVDRAETEKELATTINAVAPRVLAEEARRQDALLVHYSTDYVFDGTKHGPWVETDGPNPLNAYGATKLAGEEAIAEVGGKYLVFRTSWVYGPHGKNFLLTMLRLGRERERLTVVDDQTGAPTTSIALANATREIVSGISAGSFGSVEQWAGTYHMTCGDATTWCGFAKEIFLRAKSSDAHVKAEVIPISSAEYPTPARRPHNSVLSNEKLAACFGIQLPDWKSGLDTALDKLKS